MFLLVFELEVLSNHLNKILGRGLFNFIEHMSSASEIYIEIVKRKHAEFNSPKY